MSDRLSRFQANIRDEASTRRAIEGATAVINCVGILAEYGKQKFNPVQAEGAGRIARLSAECGVERLVHISAIGAEITSLSDYARSKARGEKAVSEAFPNATILRPSIIFGREDGFFNRFAEMAKFTPALPLVGAETKFQPVYVDDVAEAACRAATGDAAPGLYELGGPKVYSFRELMELMLKEVRRRRVLLPVPFFAAKFIGKILDLVQKISFGLISNSLLTVDQVELLKHDNVVSADAKTIADLGISPTSAENLIGDYLYAARPHGQYEAMTELAARLKS